MFTRIFNYPKKQSFFLLGPRGTGKTSWCRSILKHAEYIDLLAERNFAELMAQPDRLEDKIPPNTATVILDEVQRLPALLNVVHRLIENRKIQFVLTGSSARKLKRGGANLLAGRALSKKLYPLVAEEAGAQFNLKNAVQLGMLPMVFSVENAQDYLSAYVGTYLREEVKEEGIVRNLADFSRVLESASLSQASVLNIASVARDSAVPYESVHDYFEVLEDLLIAHRLPLFTRRAKRKTRGHPKFFYFDSGVYRSIRPKGPLDSNAEIDGASLETLVFQHLQALNDYLGLGYSLSYWRSSPNTEVDFVLYGESGFLAFEVKRAAAIRGSDLKGLIEFKKNYPEATCIVLYGGTKRYFDKFHFLPLEQGLLEMRNILEHGVA